MKTQPNYLSKWQIPWNSVEVMLSGKSAIDLDSLDIQSESEATAFLNAYGFIHDDPGDLRFLDGVFIQSVAFLQSTLIPREWNKGLKPPPEVLGCQDPKQLLLWASDKNSQNEILKDWSCALLRLMHTFVHVVGVTRFVDQQQVIEQLKSRLDPFIFKLSSGQLCFGKPDEYVEIEKFQWKPPKTQTSMVLKLLHKKANVAETIYDLLGFRIVTQRIEDMALILKYLRSFHIISFPNCNPNRSRNSVMDIEQFIDELDELIDESGRLNFNESQFMQSLSDIANTLNDGMKSTNPHSSKSYKAIQITCRQLVRSQNKRLMWLEKLEKLRNNTEFTSSKEDNLLRNIIDYVVDWPELNDYRELKSFFPYEIQILHRDAYLDSLVGSASHEVYKESQVRAARRRVLGRLLRP